jgi:membrane protein implicated in regulation of membrane protease activity
MSEGPTDKTEEACVTIHAAGGASTAGFLALTAAPVFAFMALWSAVAGGPLETVCMSGGQPWSANGMSLMYALMSVFHLSPWLKRLHTDQSGIGSSFRNNELRGVSSALTSSRSAVAVTARSSSGLIV